MKKKRKAPTSKLRGMQSFAATAGPKGTSVPDSDIFPPPNFPKIDISKVKLDIGTLTKSIENLGKTTDFKKLPNSSNFEKLKQEYRATYRETTIDALATTTSGKLNESTLPSGFAESVLDSDWVEKGSRAAAILNPRFCDRYFAAGKAHFSEAKMLREQFFELRQKAFEEQLKADEYLAIRKVHDDETAERFYELRFDKAEVLSKAANEVAVLSKESADLWQREIGDNFEARAAKYQDSLVMAAQLSGLAQTKGENANLETYSRGYDHYQTNNGKPITGNKEQMFYSNAIIGGTAAIQAALYARSTYSQHGNYLANYIHAAAERKVQELEKNWAEKDRGFRRRRTEAARIQMDRRIFEMTRENGSLNFVRLAAEIGGRFKNEMTLALTNLLAARNGLKSSYGIDNNALFPPLSGKDWFWRLANWISLTEQSLARFREKDQTGIKVLAAVLPKSGPNSLTMSLGTNDILQGAVQYVRLLGVSATAISQGGGAWECKVTPPNGLTPFFLGRVRTAQDHVEPDIAGANVLFNGNPYGMWRVDVTAAGFSTEMKLLEGIELNLHLAYQRKN